MPFASSRPTRRLPLVLAAAAAVALLVAQVGPALAQPQEDRKAESAPAELAAWTYRSSGPAWGGRVSRAVGIPGDPRTYYAATASGGVWKSSDGGRTWVPVFDDQPVSSIGSVAVAASASWLIRVPTALASAFVAVATDCWYVTSALLMVVDRA